MTRRGKRRGYTRPLQDAAVLGLGGTFAVMLVHELIEEMEVSGLTETVLGFVAPIIAAAILLRVLGLV